MSRELQLTAFAVTLGLVAGACSENTTPTAASETGIEAVTTVAHNFGNNPDNGNDRIFRFEQDAFFLIFDANSSLVAAHTSTPCALGGILEPISTQWIIENPDDPFSGQVRETLLADPINIYILDLAQGGDCFGFALVASGTGKLVNTDNDFYSFLNPDTHRSNAYGFTAQGQLTGADGSKMHYNGVLKVVWDGIDGSKKDNVNEHFNLQ
ncbi:MAG: hypothetical protein E4H03_13285 [Myxococcales bacterium]|nr:MAG: hypothetical protein E4H03_13285 [Myxococcales bacterium]